MYTRYSLNILRISFTDTLYSITPGTDMCFARQHNTSDNNNQCLLVSNGNTLLQLNPQKPGAIDNQPLVTQEPVKVNVTDLRKLTSNSLNATFCYNFLAVKVSLVIAQKSKDHSIQLTSRF